MKSKNEYVIGETFYKKRYLSTSQIMIFNHYLSQAGKSIEKIIESFILGFVNTHLENVKFKFPTESTTYIEKIRSLAPEFEFLLKQFQAYAEDGRIDFELIEFNSSPVRLSEIKSLVKKKYVYSDSDTIRALIHKFFSDQSTLYYTERFKEKYRNLYNLLINENVSYDDFKEYQKPAIDLLIQEEYLQVDSNDFIKIKNVAKMFVIGQIYKNEVLSYWHYKKEIRDAIDDMIENKLLYIEDTLLTKPEINYYNYYLNKKEFTNGFDIRNKYLHGTNPHLEKQQQIDYYSLLKLIILTLLKITDDLILYKESNVD
jgi:hypothetical protein